jgi:hypothetical protein
MIHRNNCPDALPEAASKAGAIWLTAGKVYAADTNCAVNGAAKMSPRPIMSHWQQKLVLAGVKVSSHRRCQNGMSVESAARCVDSTTRRLMLFINPFGAVRYHKGFAANQLLMGEATLAIAVMGMPFANSSSGRLPDSFAAHVSEDFK